MPNGNNVIAELQFLRTGMYRFINHGEDQRQDKFVTALDVAAAFTQQDHDSGWLPEGIQRKGYCPKGQYYVYFIPAAKTSISVLSNGETHLLKIPLPSMVMMGIGRAHFIVAVKEKSFSPNAVTYHAPLANVHINQGGICWGDNTPPKVTADMARKAWELFISSRFNNHLSGQKVAHYDTCVLDLLFELNNTKRFPMSRLLSARTNDC